jgi:hypothetical protein
MPKLLSFEVWYIIIVNGTEYPQQHPIFIQGIDEEDAASKVRKNVERNGNEVIIREIKPVRVPLV